MPVLIMAKPKTVQICANHPDYQVPLVWTTAFKTRYENKKWLCPYCGNLQLFPFGESVKETPELIERKKGYLEYAKDFLTATNILNSPVLMLEHSKEELEKFQKTKDNWTYKRKIEDILTETKH
jgi:hypothetical protein